MEQLAVWDYLLIGVYMLGVVGLGLYFSGRQESLKDYFLAGGTMPWWAVSMSIYATLLSPLTFLGVAGWVFLKDSRWFVGGPTIAIVTVFISAMIWVPIWDRLRLLSIYEYLEHRFHPAVRTFGAVLFPVQMIFWIGNGLVAASDAFEQVTGLPARACLVGIVILGSLYTVLGGSRAVIWTDVVQFVVFLFSFIVIGFLLLSHFGWDALRIYEIASSQTSEVTGYPHTQVISTEWDLSVEAAIWAIIVLKFMEIFAFGTHQVTVQRLMATSGKRQMYLAFVGTAVIDWLFTMMIVFISWGLIAFYHTNAAAEAPAHGDQVMANYVVNFVPILVRGLIMAGLLAAVMSSFDSALNSIGSVVISDFYRRYWASDRTEGHYVSVSRLVTLAAGSCLLLFALWQYQYRESTALERVAQLHVLVIGPVACFFILGVFSKRVNTPGALFGGIMSMALALVLNGFPNVFDPLITGVNWMWVGSFSMAFGLVSGYLASWLFAAPEPKRLIGLTIWP
jgi:SSS family transporter